MLFYVRDRRNIVSKKPLDIAQKENIKAHEIGTKIYSTYNQGAKKPVQNGLVNNRSNNAVSSTAATQKNALDVGPLGATISKEALNCPTSEPSLKAPLSERISLPSQEQCLIPSAPSPSGNIDISKLEVGGITTVGTEVNYLNEKGSSSENFSTLVSTTPSLKDSQSTDATKNVIVETSEKVTEYFNSLNSPYPLLKLSSFSLFFFFFDFETLLCVRIFMLQMWRIPMWLHPGVPMV